MEVYGGIGTVVHHNVASNNRTFTELGNKRSANTTYAYNEVTSNLDESEFLITRGDAEALGLKQGDTVYVRATRVPTLPDTTVPGDDGVDADAEGLRVSSS